MLLSAWGEQEQPTNRANAVDTSQPITTRLLIVAQVLYLVYRRLDDNTFGEGRLGDIICYFLFTVAIRTCTCTFYLFPLISLLSFFHRGATPKLWVGQIPLHVFSHSISFTFPSPFPLILYPPFLPLISKPLKYN